MANGIVINIKSARQHHGGRNPKERAHNSCDDEKVQS